MRKILTFLGTFKKRHPIIAAHLALQLAISIVLMAVPEVLRLATGAITYGDTHSLNHAIVLAVSATILYVILTGAEKPLEVHVRNKCEQDIQNAVIKKILATKRQHLTQYTSGDIITKATQNATEAVGRSLGVVFGIFTGACLTLASIVYMGVTSPRMTLVVVPYFILLKFCIDRVYAGLQKRSKQNVGKTKLGNAFILDILGNLTIIRAFDKKDFFSQKLEANEEAIAKINISMRLLYHGAFYVLLLFTKVAEFALVYGLAGYWVYIGALSFGVVAAFVVAIDRFEKGMRPLLYSIGSIAEVLPHIDNITTFLEDTTGQESETGLLPKGDASITLRDVSFSFNPQGGKKVIDGLNLAILPGEKVMLRGENGKGKSTLLRLMGGIYRPTEGQVLLGGHDTTHVSIQAMAEKICYISQASDMLEGNVFENLAMSARYDQALCTTILATLNMGHIVDHPPQSLSQGEKQRLNIGRTLYKMHMAKDADIILGDEIFSNIDPQNKHLITDAFFTTFANKTVVLICHDDIPFQFDREVVI